MHHSTTTRRYKDRSHLREVCLNVRHPVVRPSHVQSGARRGPGKKAFHTALPTINRVFLKGELRASTLINAHNSDSVTNLLICPHESEFDLVLDPLLHRKIPKAPEIEPKTSGSVTRNSRSSKQRGTFFVITMSSLRDSSTSTLIMSNISNYEHFNEVTTLDYYNSLLKVRIIEDNYVQ
ncbi:unnamed protein product, partial [Timema podura]|nr:unnamed protein product [Timema podura]